jgi:hypothetical protein
MLFLLHEVNCKPFSVLQSSCAYFAQTYKIKTFHIAPFIKTRCVHVRSKKLFTHVLQNAIEWFTTKHTYHFDVLCTFSHLNFTTHRLFV